jgi:type II secretory pathway component PulJ
MLKRIARIHRGALFRSEKGVNLLEVVIAVALLALITASVPTALLAITNNHYRWNEQRVAENLTRNLVEYIKVHKYIPGNSTNPQPEYLTYEQLQALRPNGSWEIFVTAQPIDSVTRASCNGTNCNGSWDDGIQEITIITKHVDRWVLETHNYKVDRVEIWQPEE